MASPNSNASTSTTQSFEKLDLEVLNTFLRFLTRRLNIVLLIPVAKQADQHNALVMLGISVKLNLVPDRVGILKNLK